MHGGQMKESLVDLTGGLINTISLEGKGDKENFKNIQNLHKKGYMMGCVIKNKELKGKHASSPELEIENLGLIINHAYSIIDILEVQGYRLIKLRNPWGYGEWKGAFSDFDHNTLTDDLKRALD